MTTTPDFYFKIKWAGPNTPVIKINDHETIVTKKDVVAMIKSLREFVDFYNNDFSFENLNKQLGEYEFNDLDD